jgi:hypothetical protein
VDDEGGFDMTERLHVFLENCQPGQVKSFRNTAIIVIVFGFEGLGFRASGLGLRV